MFAFHNGYSPTLSLATAALEIGLAVWALRGPGRREILVPTALLLLALSGYQLIEVAVCGPTGHQNFFSRLAFADVIWLPPLGMWLVAALSTPPGHSARRAAGATFGVAGAFAYWALTAPGAVTETACSVFTAQYATPDPLYTYYGAFYHLGLAGIMFGGAAALVAQRDKILRAHIADLQMGVIAFVVAALLTQVMAPRLNLSMPSVMCHYALVLAIFLGRLIARERAQQPQDAVAERVLA